jgi:hypothetical protein
MPFSSYSELQTAVGSWAFNRSGLPAADFIALGEARLNRDLRLRAMESDETLTSVADSRFIDLPTGFREALALWREDSLGRALMTRVNSGVTTLATAGNPEFWTIEGDKIAFERPADDEYTYTFRCLKSFALSDSTTTNWLLTNHADCYLAACLVEAALYNDEPSQLDFWQARYADCIRQINRQEAQSKRAPLRTEFGAQDRFDANHGDGQGSGVPIYAS